MHIPPFKLEDYFAKHEFNSPYMMGSSDPETHTLSEVMSMADAESQTLWEQLPLCYTESHGLPLLRLEISKLYKNLHASNILVFSGAEEAIYITLQMILQPGDHAIVVTPCYQSLKQIPISVGAKVTECALEWQDSRWAFNLDKLAEAITSKTKLIVINFPHNPTGLHIDRETFNSIVDIARQNNIRLFCDEVYRHSEYDANACLPNGADVYENAISMGVMSKSYGMAGLRIGWIATQDKALLKSLAAYKNYTTICNSAPSEILALIALRNKEKILKRNLEIAHTNLQLLDTFFNKHPETFEWYKPTAGFINFPRLKLNMNIDNFTHKLMMEEGVVILPGTLFDNDSNHFRLGFGRRNLPDALERLERFTLKMTGN